MSEESKNQLIKEINQLRQEKNAVILAHYYQPGEIQDIADFVGDSLQLAQKAANTQADVIVFCGVSLYGRKCGDPFTGENCSFA